MPSGSQRPLPNRGIRLIRVPTTTLAQADSGLGVKNSINLFAKKNWCGTFAVPWAVINDEQLLSTLPQRDFVCGFSEAIKVSLLKEAAFFTRICDGAKAIQHREADLCRNVLRQSAVWHLRHITRGGDPFEALEARPLDFGHWSAHKLEVMTGFELRHGEAVGIGIALDTLYSQHKFGFPAADTWRVLHCLRDLGLPLGPPGAPPPRGTVCRSGRVPSTFGRTAYRHDAQAGWAFPRRT